MQFEIKNVTKSQNDLMRAIGYKPTFFQKDSEVSIVRRVGGDDYPRFHLYIKEGATGVRPLEASRGLTPAKASVGQGKVFIFKLHLDQKKPSYEGSKKHSGEYDGPLVEGEAKRIKNILH